MTMNEMNLDRPAPDLYTIREALERYFKVKVKVETSELPVIDTLFGHKLANIKKFIDFGVQRGFQP